MRRQLVARLGQSLIVVLIVATISFFVIRSAPGDPFSYESSTITPAIRDQWRKQFAYDRPVTEQFVRYVASVGTGRFGYSLSKNSTVTQALADAIPNTLLLVGVSLGLSVVLGLIVGVCQAAKRGGWFDRISSTVLLVFYSLPDFWGALMMLLVFAYWWHVLPASGMVHPVLHDTMSGWRAFLDRMEHLVLPASTLTLLTMAAIARYQRAAMLDVLPADFIRTARAKGVSERRIVWRHGLRNALTPMVTMLGLLFPVLLGGALFVEKVFSWPGMGLLAANAVNRRDYDLVIGTVIVGSVMVVIGNLLADLLQLAIDPRVRD